MILEPILGSFRGPFCLFLRSNLGLLFSSFLWQVSHPIFGRSGPSKVSISLRTSIKNHSNRVFSKKSSFHSCLGPHFGTLFYFFLPFPYHVFVAVVGAVFSHIFGSLFGSKTSPKTDSPFCLNPSYLIDDTICLPHPALGVLRDDSWVNFEIRFDNFEVRFDKFCAFVSLCAHCRWSSCIAWTCLLV